LIAEDLSRSGTNYNSTAHLNTSTLGSEVALRGFLVPCHAWLRNLSCEKRKLDESPHLPERPRHSPVWKELIVKTILCPCSQKCNVIAREPLEGTIYQHKTPYRGVTRIIEELLAILDHLHNWSVTPVQQKFNQTVTGIWSSLT
jgi:hypothetical protein